MWEPPFQAAPEEAVVPWMQGVNCQPTDPQPRLPQPRCPPHIWQSLPVGSFLCKMGES